jgi:6-phosphogluconolactonase (cycloisomerase 2 family)
MERGRGPRHLAFHPTQPLAYIVGELDRTIVTAAYEPTTGRLHPIAERSTVPADVKTGSAAGVVLSGDARRLYVSNRGHDSVVTFPVAADGTLGDAAWMHAGRTPRFICEPPDGHALLVAREDDHSIAVSSPDQLSFVDVANTGSPVCVVFRKTP